MGRKKQVENRKQLIIDASRELFNCYGVEHTTLEMIAEKASISKSSIYIDFENKHDILLTIINEFADEQLHMMQTLANQAQDNFITTIHEILCTHFNALVAHATPHHQHANHPFLHAKPEPVFNQLPHFKPASLEAPIQLIAELLKKAAQEGEILAQKDYLHVTRLIFMTMHRNASPPHPPHLTPVMLAGMIHEVSWLLLMGLKAQRL